MHPGWFIGDVPRAANSTALDGRIHGRACIHASLARASGARRVASCACAIGTKVACTRSPDCEISFSEPAICEIDGAICLPVIAIQSSDTTRYKRLESAALHSDRRTDLRAFFPLKSATCLSYGMIVIEPRRKKLRGAKIECLTFLKI